jgi:hypothetical protein
LDGELLREIDSNKRLFESYSLYAHYLKALAVLFQPDPAAPELFGKPDWSFKSLQTALGGWALARNVFSLQAKENVYYLGQVGTPPSGFVEPVPDFFSKMSRVCEESDDLLGRQDTDDDDLEIARASLQDNIRALKKFAEAFKDNPHATMNEDIGTDLDDWLCYDITDKYPEEPADYIAQIPKLEKLASELESAAEAPKDNPKWKTLMESLNPPARANWYRLANLCSKLEALSEKQLRGVPFNKDDSDFISNYGIELAGVMFYGGNSFEAPHDDAPRICEIDYDPAKQQRTLVGTGRPEQIYVLYPYAGKQILTHGAVLTYYQFSNPTRLTDEEWKAVLSSPSAPRQPDWVEVLHGPK